MRLSREKTKDRLQLEYLSYKEYNTLGVSASYGFMSDVNNLAQCCNQCPYLMTDNCYGNNCHFLEDDVDRIDDYHPLEKTIAPTNIYI